MLHDEEEVWARDPDEGFVLGRVQDLGHGGVVEVKPNDPKIGKRVLPLSDVFHAGNPNKQVDDCCEMMYLNEATLLNNVRIRYHNNTIYTYVANILIAVNPYKEISSLYNETTMKTYRGKSLGQMPPHVFALADKALRDMRVLRRSQSIIVSGESGAGKTESTKYLLRYLCDLGSDVEQKIMDANPVLEAFGNAKTTRNNNSSRFGKFIEVHFDAKFQVVGGHISHYLLEKSRVCGPPTSEERNYHVFYLLMAGAPEELRKKLYLTQPDDFNYLKTGCTKYFTSSKTDSKVPKERKSAAHVSTGPLIDHLVDDFNDFGDLDKALTNVGLNAEGKMQIYATVAAVLHLGNIDFVENVEDKSGGCIVNPDKQQSLNICAKLMGIEVAELKQSLVTRVMQSARGGLKGTVIMVPLKIHEARSARDALAKALYSKLFDHIVETINKSIPFQASNYYIGVLDIAGFEFFTVNSYEQFCINYCNEKLQQFFNQTALQSEQLLYKREGLHVPDVEFIDNQDCIDVIESNTQSLLQLLDEESKLPKADYKHFTAEVHRRFGSHFRIAVPRVSKLKAHRALLDDEGFIVRHFAGAVCYQTKYFLEKNNDALHASLEGIVQESTNRFIQKLFENSESVKGKLSFISVGSKFKTQLGELMEKLRNNGTSFIRCVKPNNKMVDGSFEGGLCLMQLKSFGVTSVLELMEHGYPSRAPFQELYDMYTPHLPKELKSLNPRQFCEAMLHSLRLNASDYKFGITRVFFRPGKYAEFDTIMRSDSDNLKTVVENVKKFLVKSRWLQAQFTVLVTIKLKNKILYRRSALVTMQRVVRGHLARRRHLPRLKLVNKLQSLNGKIGQLESICNQLKKDKATSVNEISALKTNVDAAILRVKKDPDIIKRSQNPDTLFSELWDQFDKLMVSLRTKVENQKNAEEQERLRQIQATLEAEKLRKEAEERQRIEDEENRKKKAEMEARRKREEEQRKVQEEAEKKAAAAAQAQRLREADEQRRLMQQLEQERQDHEVAQRLAKETNEQLEDSPPMARKSEAVKSQQAALSKSKYDLSKWKYSQLRDTIHTSCDIELLEACRHEFHRRLKVYHAWKAKNRKRTTMEENERAPRSVLDAAQKALPARSQPRKGADPASDGAQRYFKIPFVRPALVNAPQTDNGKRGWWYAHFDGQYVTRQMELYPDKPAVLLVSGKDDMQMCELSLEETGLTRKRGAEILESDFNREWKRNGGQDYVLPADRKK